MQEDTILDLDESLRNALFHYSNLEIETIRLFIDAGADVNTIAFTGFSLKIATAYGNLDLVKYLVEQGTEFYSKDENIALLLATSRGYFQILKYLVENGGDVNVTNNINQSILMLAS